MVDQLLAFRAREGVDLLDVTVVVVDSFRALGWIILAIVAVIVGMLLLTAVQANPAVGVIVLLLMLPRRRHQRQEPEMREANFFALSGLLLLGGSTTNSLGRLTRYSTVPTVERVSFNQTGRFLRKPPQAAHKPPQAAKN